ncbi:hypothetical protein [Parabacteroides goldsteinii]|uniref:hypothetical protein n=1 Tax=Parabacteroides goldsteinii TaxID=328812 RepID=UPI00256FC917|nr:hypothetical protein [Parabacteroides goldsteinii]
MDSIQQITTAPETTDVSRLYESFKTIPGNESKSLYEFWLFMTAPSPERDFFLESKACPVPEFADNLVMDRYEGK